tara:strand:+ start:739 stop:882 length:144 start_codon:yes stop_codon:yes gene_type:complete
MLCPCCSTVWGGRKMTLGKDGFYECGCGYAIKVKQNINKGVATTDNT